MARKRKLEPEVLQDTDGWMVTFSDLMSLMLTFFVLMISMSTLDQTKLKNISSEFNKALLLLNAGAGTDALVAPVIEQSVSAKLSPREMMLALRQHSMSVFKHSVLSHKVKTLVLRDRLILRINNATLFAPGRADLDPKHVRAMKQLARMLAVSPGAIRVEGYADRSEVLRHGPFPDTWSLSLARAASVLHALEAGGVNPGRLSLAGYGPGVRGQGSGVSGRKTAALPSSGAARHVDIVLFQPGSQ